MVTERLAYELVDVFAEDPFAGNQLAVVFGADDLRDDQLQAIACEFNLSETTFPVRRTDADVAAGADYRVRIFTIETELPFAGHPTLGTAWVLARRGAIRPGSRVQACGAGLIDVAVPEDPGSPLELGATPRDGAIRLPDASTVACAESIGLTADDVAGPAFASGCGISFVQLRVRRSALAVARPRFADMSEVDLGGGVLRDPLIGIYVHAVGGDATSGLEVNARMFVPGPSELEDPATGSAAAGLGIALVAAGDAAADGLTAYRISQGVELGRPSTLLGRVQAEAGVAHRCWVGGRVEPIAAGSIRVPA